MSTDVETPYPVVEEENPNPLLKTPTKPELVVIHRVFLNYGVIAVVCLVIGSLLGATVLAPARSDTITLNMVSTAVAAAMSNSGDVRAAAPAPVLNVSTDDDPAWGPSNAPVTLVEFSDFQCPFCGRFHRDTYPQLKQTYGDKIRFVYRDYPIVQLHPNAEISAEAADCVNEQGKYWDYHDLLLSNQEKSSRTDLGDFARQLGLDMNAFNQCLDSGTYRDEVAKDIRDGDSYGVQGTPTFFINGRALVGAQPYAVFASAIDAELAKVG